MCTTVLRLCDTVVLYLFKCKFNVGGINMLSLEERINVTELLSGLDLDDLISLASTTTKGLLKPSSKEEANEAILQHSDTVESILSRKKVSRELIFTYLHWKKVTTDSNLDKKSLINLLLNYWKEQSSEKVNCEANRQQANVQNAPEQQNQQVSQVTNSQAVLSQLELGQVDCLAQKFSEWYYQLLNKDFLEGGNFALGAENFWNDASLQMQLSSNGQLMTEEAEGSTNVAAVIGETKQRHNLYFSPNLSAEGVKGRSEPHGMVSVLVCGTLHQSAGVLVGVFEQIFYLIKDPLTSNAWKIKRTQLNLTSKNNIAALPTLSEGELTRPLLPIENPD